MNPAARQSIRWIRAALVENLAWKALSLIVATVLWALVAPTSNPTSAGRPSATAIRAERLAKAKNQEGPQASTPSAVAISSHGKSSRAGVVVRRANSAPPSAAQRPAVIARAGSAPPLGSK